MPESRREIAFRHTGLQSHPRRRYGQLVQIAPGRSRRHGGQTRQIGIARKRHVPGFKDKDFMTRQAVRRIDRQTKIKSVALYKARLHDARDDAE